MGGRVLYVKEPLMLEDDDDLHRWPRLKGPLRNLLFSERSQGTQPRKAQPFFFYPDPPESPFVAAEENSLRPGIAAL